MKKKIFTLLILLLIIVPFNVKAITLDCTSTLYRGKYNDKVATLQTMLNRVMSSNLTVDKSFGPLTENTVIKFQKKYNLETDGHVGPKTCKKINEVYKKYISKKRIMINVNDLNIRNKPGTNNTKILSQTNKGKIYIVYDKKIVNNEIWYKIKYKKKHYGYICGSYGYTISNFIITDISSQYLIYYKNGKEIVYTPVVTGNKNNHDTPIGFYTLEISNMDRNITLTGNNDDSSKYESYVNYWMNFIPSRGIGFHDASWRSSFGGEIYKGNGSHGCVNMPYEAAKTLYNEINENTFVYIRK